MRYTLIIPVLFFVQGCQRYYVESVKMDTVDTVTMTVTKVILINGHLRLLVNNPGADIRVFSLANSWGAYAYTLRIRAGDASFDIKRRDDLMWTRNGPGVVELRHGENTIDFTLSDGSWDGATGLDDSTAGHITSIEVLYRTNRTDESTRLNVSLGPIAMIWRERS